MYGFFITNKGEELLGKALTGEKVKITKACFGSGGNHNEPYNYEITELVSQFYEKELDPVTDLVTIDPARPNQIEIITELPANVSGTINEIGYKDEADNLILYGLVQEEVKKSENNDIFHYESYIDLEQNQVESIEFNITSTDYNELRTLIAGLQNQINNLSGGSDLEQRVQTLETFKDDITEQVQSLEDLPDRVTTIETSNEDLTQRVQTLEDTVGSAVERLNGAL